MTDTQLLQAIYGDLQNVKSEMEQMVSDIGTMKSDMDAMKADIAGLKTQVRKNSEMLDLVRVILDMETNRNIKIIAEGHQTLSRKLDAAIQMSSDIHTEQAIYKILLNRHERQLNSTI